MGQLSLLDCNGNPAPALRPLLRLPRLTLNAQPRIPQANGLLAAKSENKSNTSPSLGRRKRKKPFPPLAGREFKLVKDLQAEINRICQTYRPHNEPVCGPDGALLLCYMRHHDGVEAAETRHGEMRTIEIRHNLSVPLGYKRPIYDQYQIWLVFADGYAEPFSYSMDQNSFGVVDDSCAASRRRLRWIDRAARLLVSDQVLEHLQVHMDFDGTCEISGASLAPLEAEVHHAGRSFKWLLYDFLTDWCASNGLSPNAIEICSTDTIGGKKFESDELCEAWCIYHASNAQLQVLSGVEHRKQHTGMVQPPWGELFQ